MGQLKNYPYLLGKTWSNIVHKFINEFKCKIILHQDLLDILLINPLSRDIIQKQRYL